jgi:hypothetical protein
MTGRQKMEAALSPGGSPAIPAVICYEDIFFRDHWGDLTPCPWWYQHAPDIERQMEWRRDAIAHTGQDWFCLPLCAPREEREAISIEVRPDGVFRRDRRTGATEPLEPPRVGGWTAPGRLHSVRPERLMDSVAQIDDAVPLPTPADLDVALSAGVGDLAAAMLSEFGRDLCPICHVAGPLWLCYYLWGFEGMMETVALRPDLVEHACERLLAQSIHSARLAAAIGARGIWIEDCMTDAVSPDTFARLNVPALGRLVAGIRALGMRSIYYYCGDPADRWEQLFAVGADALSLEESKKGFRIEIEDVVERAAGRCAVLGNLDAMGLLEKGADAELRDEIARQLQAGRRSGGRFIMSLGSPVTPGTSVERVRLYCSLVRGLSRG